MCSALLCVSYHVMQGTTTPISFVHDVLFPHAAAQLEQFLKANWESEQLKKCVDELRQQVCSLFIHVLHTVSHEASRPSEILKMIATSLSSAKATQRTSMSYTAAVLSFTALNSKVLEEVAANIRWQMAADRKTTSLKALQGMIWKSAYESGELKGRLVRCGITICVGYC